MKPLFNRRQFAKAGALAGVSFLLPRRFLGSAKKSVLVFTKSSGFEHDVVKIKDGKPSIVDEAITSLGKKHGFDVTAHVTDLGELTGFHFEERRIGQLGKTPRDLCLADAGGPDHENIFRRNFLPQAFIADAHAPPAVAQRNRHRALGRGLSDDVLVEFLDDLARCHDLRHG